MDPKNIAAIKDWPTLLNISDVRSFHGLASFYRRFVPNFNTNVAYLNDIVKKRCSV